MELAPAETLTKRKSLSVAAGAIPVFGHNGNDKPNIVIMGVPRSGTSVLTQMFFRLGWEGNHANPWNGEYQLIYTVSRAAVSVTGNHKYKLDLEAAESVLENLRQPWVVKGQRFVSILDRWTPALVPYNPLLIWLERDISSVANSWRKIGKFHNRNTGRAVSRLTKQAARQFEMWPLSKVHIHYEDLARAISLFDVRRSGVTP